MGKETALGAPSKTQQSSQTLKPNLDGSHPVPSRERSPLPSSTFASTEAAALLASRRPQTASHTQVSLAQALLSRTHPTCFPQHHGAVPPTSLVPLQDPRPRSHRGAAPTFWLQRGL